MKVNMISNNNIREYMSILTADEIYGITEGRYTTFVMSTGAKNEPFGIMTVQIFPEFIKLERIFVLPEFRRKGFASGLLGIIQDSPKEGRLPIYAFLEDEEDVIRLLKASDFKSKENGYSVITGRLGDWIDMSPRIEKLTAEDMSREIKVLRIHQVRGYLLRDFILSSPHDELLQFPDKTMDLERFSDISTVCMMDNEIKAAALIEETEDASQFTWLHGEDSIALLYCIDAVIKELGSEYAPGYRIRCLCRKESEEKVYEKLFSKCERKTISIYNYN